MRVPRGARLSAAVVLSSLLAAGVAAGPLPLAAGAGPACGEKIGYLGPLTGPNASAGQSMVHGVDLAVSQYNAAHPGCTVGVLRSDSQGDPAEAPGSAGALVSDAAVLGVVGPAFSGETLASGHTFAAAGLPTITPSATNPLTSQQHWATFHRLIASDSNGGRLLARYVASRLGGTRVAVVADNSTYGRTFARAVKVPLAARVKVTASVREGQRSFRAVVRKIRKGHAKVVVYGGYDPEAGRLDRQLAKAGYRGWFVTGDGAYDSRFAAYAGAKAAARALVATGFAPPTYSPSFVAAYRAAFGVAPQPYALESYDAAKVFLGGIGAGVSTRSGMQSWVTGYDAKGLSKQIRFSSTGELAHPPVWVYRPKGRIFAPKAHLH